MKRILRVWSLVVTLACFPATVLAVSAVFSGDPIDSTTGLPYEILPGFPLVLPGPDRVLGTPDDVVDPSVVGDIDMVVRSGSLPPAAAIPPPAALSGPAALPVGVAGSTVNGGVEIPFTVFLSDGLTSNDAPAGHVLAAPDMDGIPVIVVAFADLDGDGFIGPTNQDDAGAADNNLEVRELEPVGRTAALFSGGVARGSIAVRAGLPASRGGLRVLLAAMALTGPFDQTVFSGNVPTGPAIATALPFLPERDLAKLIRDRVAPAGPNTTLQPLIQFVALPSPTSTLPFALRLDGTEPTTDVAIVNSQPAVGVAFREDVQNLAAQRDVTEVVLGTTVPANHRRIRVVAVDRWSNPADAGAGFTVTLHATPPLRVARPPRAAHPRNVILRATQQIRLDLAARLGTPESTTGTLTAEHNGAVVAALTIRVDARANRPRADVVVPSLQAATIQSAVETVTDVNHDGQLVVDVRPGLYRETVTINRGLLLRGSTAGTTIVQGDGTTSTIRVNAPGTTVQQITAVGGEDGFALDAANAVLTEAAAWHNRQAGVTVTGAGTRIWRTAAVDNGSDGLFIGPTGGALCSENTLADNLGFGANLSATPNPQLDNNLLSGNAAGGLNLASVNTAAVADNLSVDNIGPGIQLVGTQNSQVLGNLSAVNDDDGLRIDSEAGGTGGAALLATSAALPRRSGNAGVGNLVSGNVLDTNHGYGLFVRRSPNDDFSAADGLQPPPGDNDSLNNRKGNVFVRTN